MRTPRGVHTETAAVRQVNAARGGVRFQDGAAQRERGGGAWQRAEDASATPPCREQQTRADERLSAGVSRRRADAR